MGPGETHHFDPFFKAASRGSTGASRTFGALRSPCRHLQDAHIDAVYFLLNSQPAYVRIRDREADGTTALLFAAASFFRSSDREENDEQEFMLDHVARGEELMQMLLKLGACARDATIDEATQRTHETVLSLAISRASPGLVKHLIDEGADVHEKTTCNLISDSLDPVWDVTPLHIASFFLNAEGIQILVELRGSGTGISDMVTCRDSYGRIPLHWAAVGHNSSRTGFLSKTKTVWFTSN